MMTMTRTIATLLLTPTLGAIASAQLPTLPTPPTQVASPLPAVSSPLTPASGLSAPISAPPSPVGIAAYPPPPGGPTLGSFLGLSYPQREYRQRRLARTPIGKLRTRIQEPLSKITGGLIPPFPPAVPSLAELQAPGPVGAMAKVKLDREAAGERIEAVRYLGKVDCHYWPEAGDALVDALRADRNEWVRLAAAETLGTGCCCTKKTIMALSMVVSCSIEDGNPVEKSPQVIAAAQSALAHCLARACACETELYVQPEVAPVLPSVDPIVPERKLGEEVEPAVYQAAWSKPAPSGQAKNGAGLPEAKTAHAKEKSYYERVDAQPWGSVIAAAKNAMQRQPMVPADVRLAGYRHDLERSGVVMQASNVQPSDRPANLLDMLLGNEPAPQPTRTIVYAQPTALPQQIVMPTTPPASVVVQAEPTNAPPLFEAKKKPTKAPTKLAVIEPMPKLKPRAIELPAAIIVKPLYEGTTQAVAVQTMLNKPGDPDLIRQAVKKLTVKDLDSTPKLPMMLLRVAEAPADTELRAACIRALGQCSTEMPGLKPGLERLTNERDTVVRVEATLALEDLHK